MVDELRETPGVVVSGFNTFSPATDSDIGQAEQALGARMDNSIESFYRQTNGLQLTWIFEDNEQFDAQRHAPKEDALDWDYMYYDYHAYDGAVMILPLPLAFSKDWEEQVYFDFMTDEEEQAFSGETYGLLSFAKKIKPFDCFSKYYDMAFFLNGTGNPPVILGDDHQACYTDSKRTDFASYMEFVLANKGVVSRRNGFYHEFGGHDKPPIETPQSYFSKERVLDLSVFRLKEIFPLSDKPGSSTAGLQTAMMQQMAETSKPITKSQFQKITEEHHKFLASGGAGGKWQTVQVSGLVIGIYSGVKFEEGEQAVFDRKHIPASLDLSDTALPFSNFCGCFAKGVDFSGADLSRSLFTDSMLAGTLFAEARLNACDFSRANLQGANFVNADLRDADFENCDLTGADFTGALLEGSKFPGAILKDVKHG